MSGADDGQERPGELPGWVPEGVDVMVPNVARMYDYILGGYHNFAIDREYAEKLGQVFPGLREGAFANRAFLGRVVRWLVSAGIRQFLDIGSGIPTAGNVHEVAEQAASGVRVMYVDVDPIAVAHTRAILAGNPHVSALQADLRSPLSIVDHPDVTDLLDFSEPVAVVLASVLHFIPDIDDPRGIVGQFRDAVVSGSYIVLSHAVHVAGMTGAFDGVRQLSRQTPTPFYVRTPEQVARLLTGFDVVEPGIVTIGDWHPDPHDCTSKPWPGHLVAVARKP
jgi:S-adenosyl methyltransferase